MQYLRELLNSESIQKTSLALRADSSGKKGAKSLRESHEVHGGASDTVMESTHSYKARTEGLQGGRGRH